MMDGKGSTNTTLSQSQFFVNTTFNDLKQYTVLAKINAHQKQWFFKGGSTQNRWVLMDDFSQGRVHKTDGVWWVIFHRGEYTKPMGFDGFWNLFYCFWKLSVRGVYFVKYGQPFSDDEVNRNTIKWNFIFGGNLWCCFLRQRETINLTRFVVLST